jgi:hypothetical protein
MWDPLVEINELEKELVSLAYIEDKLRRFIRRENIVARDYKRCGLSYDFQYRDAATQQLEHVTRRADWVEVEIRRLRDKHVRNVRWPEVKTRPIRFKAIERTETEIQAAA